MPNLPTETSSFLKSVARYFMDFLETDFHRRRVPRRSIKLKNDTGQLLGIAIDKYPTFDREAWKVAIGKFDDGGTLNIQRGRYKADIPKNLLELIERQINKLDQKKIEAVRKELATSIENFGVSLKDEYTKARNHIEEDLYKSVEKNISKPLIDSIEKSLMLLESADENTAYQILTELTEQFVTLLMPITEAILQAIVVGEEIDIERQTKSAISMKSAKMILSDYFKDLATNDLFQELAEIESNRLILDKQELYFYFFDISYQRAKYPLFYIPVQITRDQSSLQVQFDSKVYINKKAVEYIAQELGNEDASVKGSPLDFDRIMYLTSFENPEAFIEKLSEITNHLVTYFDLRGELAFTAERAVARNSKIKVTNSAYFSLFDKADEALINDYEQILDMDAGSELFAEFEAIIKGFITDEPKDVGRAVENEWDGKDSTEKLAFESPVPLNSEQLQIIQALSKPDCRYISVEGPPGTGKSHTITALVFNAILQNKSVLVLSDKKEALDVVEEKIADTLNNVRFGTDFQNPILRLGASNNFRKVLSPQVIENIKLTHRLTGKKLDQLEESIEANLKTTKEQIRHEIEAYSKLNLGEISELEKLEESLDKVLTKINTEELVETKDPEVRLDELRQSYKKLKEALIVGSPLVEAVSATGMVSANRLLSLSLNNLIQYSAVMAKLVEHTSSVFEELEARKWTNIFKDFPNVTSKALGSQSNFLLKFNSLKKPIVGFAFSKTKVSDLLSEFNKKFGTNFTDQSDISRIKEAHQAFAQLLTLKTNLPFSDAIKERIDYLNLLSRMSDKQTFDGVLEFSKLHDDLKFIVESASIFPNNLKGVDESTLDKLGEYPLFVLEDADAEKVMRWLHLMSSIRAITSEVPIYSYRQYMETVQKQVTLRMAQILDGRVVDFYTDSRATAAVVKEVIRAKQKFPKETFSKLKEAFPCILAGIREYADYIPLEVGIFDLVIIDEASQVSVAQAFPALIRGKKVIVMGDRLQFGNVKSYQARSEINVEYQNKIKEAFAKKVTKELEPTIKIQRLNIKSSILEFAEFVSNYKTTLKKHFRSYPENISFSNKYFYNNGLQVMKIRGKKIEDVLKFTFIKHDGKLEPRPNTNLPEAEFIISELRKLADKNDSSQTVGIITPHTNQQRYIFELLRSDPHFDFYLDKLRLKVMTFDTCQGEERDIIYYSMVASESDDKLSWIFPRDITEKSYDSDSDSEIRRQRLNVGFSRSKETMHFVLSKPLEKYNGSIGVALNHYSNLKAEVSKRLTAEAVDQKSPMEKKVLGWVYETPFWQTNSQKKSCDLQAQFKLGEYLKQLDPTYSHPKFIVDFILFYQDEGNRVFKIIIEYDGFEEHFETPNMVDKYNYESYLKEEDVYRQKVLESYGYEFIRLNRFNVGKDPVKYINDQIQKIIDGSLVANSMGNDIDTIIRSQATGLTNGELKECKNCGKVIPVDEFKDSTLASGIGRICRECKNKSSTNKIKSKKVKKMAMLTGQPCPQCGRMMVLRDGRFGKFYGCSGFPYCKHTQSAYST